MGGPSDQAKHQSKPTEKFISWLNYAVNYCLKYCKKELFGNKKELKSIEKHAIKEDYN